MLFDSIFVEINHLEDIIDIGVSISAFYNVEARTIQKLGSLRSGFYEKLNSHPTRMVSFEKIL
jgi:hypothetical protein